MRSVNVSAPVSRRRLLVAGLNLGSGFAIASLLQACGAAAPAASTTVPATGAPAPSAPTAAPTTASQAAPTQATTAPAAAPTAPPGQVAQTSSEPASLTHWAHPFTQDDSTVFNPLVKQFQQANPTISIHIEYVPWTNRIQKVMSAVAANAAPDTSYLNVDEFTTYVVQNVLAPLDQYISSSKMDLNDFIPGPRAAMDWQGKYYELPIEFPFRVAYYNVDLWQQAGLDPTKTPTTWDEYTQAMDQLKSAKSSGKLKAWPTWMAVLADIPVGNFNPWFYQAGGSFLTKDGKSGYDSEAGITALKFMVKTFQQYCNPSDAADKGNDLQSLFGQQQYVYQNNYELKMIKQVAHDFPDIKLGIANTLQGKIRWTHGGVGAQGIYAESKYKDQTWKWINFLTSGKPNLDFNIGFGYVPPRQSVMDQFKKTTTDKLYLRALEEAQYGGIEKAPGLWDAWAIVEPMIQAAILGKMEPEAALKQASDQINSQVLSKYPGVAAG